MTQGLQLLGLHHVGIAVRDLDEALVRYRAQFGAAEPLRRTLVGQGVDAAALRCGEQWVELIAPLDDSSAVHRFLDRRGEGLHHVAYAVADVQQALDAFAATGGRLIDEHPHDGLHGLPVAFVHPASTGGVLTEFVQVEPALR